MQNGEDEHFEYPREWKSCIVTFYPFPKTILYSCKWDEKCNIVWEIFTVKNYSQNVVEKQVTNTFLKYWNWTYIWITSPNIYKVCFYCMSKLRITNTIYLYKWDEKYNTEKKLYLVSSAIWTYFLNESIVCSIATLKSLLVGLKFFW